MLTLSTYYGLWCFFLYFIVCKQQHKVRRPCAQCRTTFLTSFTEKIFKGGPESKTIPVVLLHEREEMRYYSMFHIMVIRLKMYALWIHFEVLTQGKPLNLGFMFYTNDDCDISGHEWGSESAAVARSSGTFSFLVGGTHYYQAHAGGLLHLLHSKHSRPELLDNIWCRKTQNWTIIQVILLLIANTVHKNPSYEVELDTVSSDKYTLWE